MARNATAFQPVSVILLSGMWPPSGGTARDDQERFPGARLARWQRTSGAAAGSCAQTVRVAVWAIGGILQGVTDEGNRNMDFTGNRVIRLEPKHLVSSLILFYQSYADEVSYQALDRNSYALVLSSSSQCAGFLLDEWSSAEFDAKTSTLRMMVYRPVGEIFEKRSVRVCEVEERWVEVRLTP
jgi:hypothetical protein